MERKVNSEKFQPIISASFNRFQLEQVLLWVQHNNVTTNSSFVHALKTLPLDEKGKPMNEKSKNRLSCGVSTLIVMEKEGQDLSRVRNIQVWSTPDKNKLDIRWDETQHIGKTRFEE